MAKAKDRGIQAIVDVGSFVFDLSGDAGATGGDACPFGLAQDAPQRFGNLVDLLVSNGYLVPNDPFNGTVLGFYPVDEPELCGLKDVNGSPHPALMNAINAIRGNPNTSNFPLVVITTKNWNDVSAGLSLYDWVGNQRYSKSAAGYLSAFDTFSLNLSPNQRTMLVPQASEGGIMASHGDYHDPDPIFDRFLADSKVVAVMPFLWSHAQTTGVSQLPEIRGQYIDFGDFVKTGAPLDLVVDILCSHNGGGLFHCLAEANRGSPPYVFEWTNALSTGGNEAWYSVECGFMTKTAMVTVNDSADAAQSASDTLSCPGGTVIQ